MINRVLSFINKIVCNQNSPACLRGELKRTILVNKNYELRSNNKLTLEPVRTKTKFGDLIFKNLCSKIVNKIDHLDLYSDQKEFKTDFYVLQDDIIAEFGKQFLNFNFDFSKIKFYK